MQYYQNITTSFPTWAHGLLILLSVLALAKGALWLVDAAVGLSKSLGVSELIIGLTVVAMGTSAPEFAVTLLAALDGRCDVSVGNVVGSNIFNLGFILGGCALLRAIPTETTLVRRDGTIIAATTILLLLLIGYDLRLDRHDGLVLVASLCGYLLFLFSQRHMAPGAADELAAADGSDEQGSVASQLLVLSLSMLLVVAGSQLLIDSSSAVARAFGLSDWVIGVTVVAAGTSAPELATSIVGVVRKRYALSAGNVIGSDIFNMLGVLGVAGLAQPMQIDPMARASLFALTAMVLLVVFFMRTGWRVSRIEGLVLLLAASARWMLNLSI